jgi:hypothetical protein
MIPVASGARDIVSDLTLPRDLPRYDGLRHLMAVIEYATTALINRGIPRRGSLV